MQGHEGASLYIFQKHSAQNEYPCLFAMLQSTLIWIIFQWNNFKIISCDLWSCSQWLLIKKNLSPPPLTPVWNYLLHSSPSKDPFEFFHFPQLSSKPSPSLPWHSVLPVVRLASSFCLFSIQQQEGSFSSMKLVAQFPLGKNVSGTCFLLPLKSIIWPGRSHFLLRTADSPHATPCFLQGLPQRGGFHFQSKL